MKIIGHAGAAGLAPANTRISFELALKNKVDEIECDICVTRDGVPVLAHDATFIVNGTKAHIPDISFEELHAIDASILTLPQALELTNGMVILQCEIKPEQNAAPVFAVLKKAITSGLSPESLVISSYDWRILQAAQSALPSVPRGMIHNWSSAYVLWRARRVNATRISLKHIFLWGPVIRGITKRGYKLTPFTLDDPKRALRFAGFGMYGVITNHPERFRRQ